MLNGVEMDCPNTDLLEHSFVDRYSNAVDPDTITASTNAAIALGTAYASRPKNEAKQEAKAQKQAARHEKRAAKKESKASCGRKPLLGKAKKQKWQQCVDKFVQSKSDTNLSKSLPDRTSYNESPEINSKNKETFLGMPKPVGIIVTVSVAVGLGALFYFKVIKQPLAGVPAAK